MTQDPRRVERSIFPQGDGAGTTLLIGWGYNAGMTLAIGAAHKEDGRWVWLDTFAEIVPAGR